MVFRIDVSKHIVYLKQVVKKATLTGNNILGLIFTNIALFYQIPCILAPLSTSDHNSYSNMETQRLSLYCEGQGPESKAK
jgi:hypothetical protein